MSDGGPDYAQLQAQVRAFVEARQWQHFHSPKNLAMALIVEAAELVEHFQWATEDESGQLQPAKRQAVGEEMADILIYLTSLATRLDINLIAAAQAKLEKNALKYPAEQCLANNPRRQDR